MFAYRRICSLLSLSGPAALALIFRVLLGACLLGMFLPGVSLAEERPPLPLRVLPMPLGTLCTGILPACARNGDTGLHLRIGLLAGLREDRSVGWVQGDAGFLVSVMRWAELGVYLPVTWFDSIQPTLQPLRVGGKLSFLSPSRWQALAGSVFTEVRIAKGPFSGEGSPLGAQPTAVDVGVALEGRISRLQAQGLAWLTGGPATLELHAALEAGVRVDPISPFVQARLDSRPGCVSSDSPLCGVGGAVVGGLRGSFDVVSATPFAGAGAGSGHASVLVGIHTGLSFDVDFVRRHGDGSAEAQAFWERRAASARAWWAEQFAEREYQALTDQLRRQQQRQALALGERLNTQLDELPRPEDALRLLWDAVTEDPAEVRDVLGQPLTASTLGELRELLTQHRTSPATRLHSSGRRKSRALLRDADGSPKLALADPGIAWERFVTEQTALLEELNKERRLREEALRVPYKPPVLPPMEKVAINAALLAPFELLAAFYMGSPEGVAQMAVIRRDLRPMAYTEEERELGEALEAAYQTMFAVGTSLTGGVSRAAELAATRGAVRALEAETVALTARAAEPVAAAAPATGRRLSQQLVGRLNPFNYALDGLGSNFGNVRFRPPKQLSIELPEGVATGSAEHVDEAAARNIKNSTARAAEADATKAAELADSILVSERRGSGLKMDPMHRSASFPSRDQLAAGKTYTIRGGDGVERKLLQAPGEVNGRAGIFEYILDPSGTVTHQRFIPGGTLTGRPNQVVK